MIVRKLRTVTFLLAMLPFGLAASANAQSNKGPLVPPPKYESTRVSNEPRPAAPPIPEEEIVKKFAANEDVMKKQYDAYTFSQTIRVEEMTDPGGKFTATGEVSFKPDGQRYMRVTKPPESDLKITNFSLEDVRTIASLPLFVLTTEEIGNYTFKYAGQDKLDDLNTYVFQVTPKQISRTRRFFQGVVWIDDHDYAIVKSFGKFVSEIPGSGSKLPFSMFETYRENFQNKYWLPTYTRSDDSIPGPSNSELPLRLVIHSTNFRLTPLGAIPETPSPTPAAAPTASVPETPRAAAPAKPGPN
jgi:hypothetical protein